MSAILKYLETRIEELQEADRLFCETRWDKTKPQHERELARQGSNEVTGQRQELQQVIKLIHKEAEASQTITTEDDLITLFYNAITGDLALFNKMHPDCQLSMEDVINHLQRKK